MTSVPYPFHSQMAKVELERLSEKGPSEASKAALGIVRRAKRAENGAHGGPQGRAEVASGAFRTVSPRTRVNRVYGNTNAPIL